VGAIVLPSRQLGCNQNSGLIYTPYLSTSVDAHALQFRANSVNNIHEVPKQRNVPFRQPLEIIRVSVRRIEHMRNILTDTFQLVDILIDGLREIDGYKVNARVSPVVGKLAARRHHNLRPVELVLATLPESIVAELYHSNSGRRIKCSTIAWPLMPLAPVTKATLGSAGTCGFMFTVDRGLSLGVRIELGANSEGMWPYQRLYSLPTFSSQSFGVEPPGRKVSGGVWESPHAGECGVWQLLLGGAVGWGSVFVGSRPEVALLKGSGDSTEAIAFVGEVGCCGVCACVCARE
jgi:hypothetical protein